MEREYKFALASQAEGERILASPDLAPFAGARRLLCMECEYYSDARGVLPARGYTLRFRRENGRGVCCLKLDLPGGADGAVRREEWELAARTPEEGFAALAAADGVTDEYAALAALGFHRTAEFRYIRRAVTLTAGGMTAELAFDHGDFGSPDTPFYELELEYKSGDEEEFRRYAASLAARFGLTAEPRSKYARALKASGKR